MNRTRSCALAGIVALVALALCDVVLAQESPVPFQPPPALPVPSPNNAAGPCVEPPLVHLGDYNGPLKDVGGLFARDLERKTVHPPSYKAGAILCPYTPKDKFVLFVHDTTDPVTFLAAGFNAGLSQALNLDPTFGQGGAGYGKRYGVALADQVSFNFFKDFVYPSVLSEDPRYYRRLNGSSSERFLHAVSHVVIAHKDDGRRMFNFSEWLGTTSAVALGNIYHPGNERGFAGTAEQVGYNVLLDVGFDLLREFLPEISRTFRLPFNVEPAPHDSNASPAGK
jgi:hypothetical protein